MSISSEDYQGLKHRPYSVSSRALDKRRTEIGICRATDRMQESGRPVLVEHCTLRYPTHKMAREVAEALPSGPDTSGRQWLWFLLAAANAGVAVVLWWMSRRRRRKRAPRAYGAKSRALVAACA